MTIEEKAKETYYVPKHLECKEANDEVQLQREAFINGAEWMLEKACEYIRQQLPVQYPEWAELAKENVEIFKKAMEE